MKKHILFLFLTSLVSTFNAQITITNAIFPVAGDTLRTILDDSPEGVEITAAGGPQTWNFSMLNGEIPLVEAYRPASEGTGFASFPEANLYTYNQLTETYYQSTSNTLSILGFSGQVPAGGFPIDAIIKYSPPQVQLNAPLQFFDIHTADNDLNIPFAVADLPSEIADSLGILTGLADSIRIRISITRLDAVDAFGTLSIPGGTYDVLREKRTTYQEVRFDVHTFLGWLDVTDQIIAAGLPGFGVDTSYSHVFVSNVAKEPIAVVNTSDGLTPVSVTYKDNGVTSSSGDNGNSIKMELTIAPNPVAEETAISWPDLHPGTYRISVYDFNGCLIHQEKTNNISILIQARDWPAGIYSCVLSNDHGNNIGLARLIKM